MKLSNTARLLCLVLSMTLIMGLMIGCRQSPEAEVTHTSSIIPNTPPMKTNNETTTSSVNSFEQENFTENGWRWNSVLDEDSWITTKIQLIEDYWNIYGSREPYTQMTDYDAELVYPFQNAYAVYIHGPVMYLDVVQTVIVNGLTFYFPNTQPLYIYSDGHFHTLQSAYSQQIITEADLSSLHSYLSNR